MEDQNKHSFHHNQTYQSHQQTPQKTPKKRRFAKADAWLKAHPKKSLAMLVLSLFVLGGGFIFALGGGSFDAITTPAKAKEPVKFYSKITGKEVTEAQSKRPVTAVMIENSPDARPQSGLAEAGLVFEAVAEGGITRFLVLYQEDQPAVIGPVRSVRPHYASLVAPFEAGLAHVGGSDIPLRKLRSGSIRDLDQFFNPEAYRRATDRFAPHNVYTSAKNLDELNKAKKYTSSEFTPWKFSKKATPSTKPTARTITIPVSEGLFAVSYKWNATRNTYSRSQGGAAHTDREKGVISPTTVIAMQVPHDVIKESNSYSYPNVNTKGTAWLFQNGTVKKIKWNKAGDKSMIAFTDEEGKTVTLNPGRTWISLIKPSAKPTWK